jgi:putative ABC transport system substrate-binding protein
VISRRTFIAAALASAATPLSAQKPAAKAYRIGILDAVSRAGNAANIEEFRKGLRQLGYVEGSNLELEYRGAEGREERFPALAAELAARKVDLILVSGTPAALAAKNLPGRIPVVSASVVDPVDTGLVASVERPGGKVTGMATLVSEVEARRLDLLRALAPGRSSVAVLVNMGNPALASAWKAIEAAAPAMKLKAQLVDVRRPENIAGALGAAIAKGAESLVVRIGALSPEHRAVLIQLAAKHRLPAVYAIREFVDAGGLASYGVNTAQLYYRAATFADKIFKGADPAGLAMERPSKFEFVINRRTVRALDLAIPPDVLLRAETVA